jgi:hypothetical protein
MGSIARVHASVKKIERANAVRAVSRNRQVPTASLGVDRPQPGGEDDAADGVDVAAEAHTGQSAVFNGFRSRELL